MIYMDERWEGAHGIGRFAIEVSRGLPHCRLPLSGRPMAAWDPLRLSLALAHTAPDSIFFSPGYNAPVLANRRFIFTLHDLNHIDRPENSSFAKRFYYAAILKRACREASAVLTVSEFSRLRIIQWSGADPDTVFNVGNGVSPSFHPRVEPFAPGYPYVLCVSNRRLHKNEARLVDAFHRSGLGSETRLLFTGHSVPALEQQIGALGLATRVVFLGQVTEALLPSIYRGALCLAFPSLYEGFGLPVIEAFACGTPVVTSNTTSLPEVAGDAALLVDPESISDISSALVAASTQASVRGDLIQKGLERAIAFDWGNVRERLQRVMDGVCRQ